MLGEDQTLVRLCSLVWTVALLALLSLLPTAAALSSTVLGPLIVFVLPVWVVVPTLRLCAFGVISWLLALATLMITIQTERQSCRQRRTGEGRGLAVALCCGGDVGQDPTLAQELLQNQKLARQAA